MEYPPECQLDEAMKLRLTLITGVVLSSRLHAVFVFCTLFVDVDLSMDC